METLSNIETFPTSDHTLYRRCIDALGRNDLDEAIGIGTKLVDKNFNHANTTLGAAYEKRGDISGSADDYEKALFYYRRAVETVGATEAWLALARLFYLGKGVQRNEKIAFDYYLRIVEDVDNPIAHLMLGKMYLDGEGVKTDIAKAKSHLVHPKSQGYVFAYTYLGTALIRENQKLLGAAYRIQAGFMATLSSLGLRSYQLRRI
ncbi:MAG: tetratricopeptide repeat protein [Pseudomonadota bacterium]|nr:sel1 repeat family protein [Acidobacteriaceae bacterium]MCZ8323542.1 tetratricopeptide repeat protein [Novosphingobium sp.]